MKLPTVFAALTLAASLALIAGCGEGSSGSRVAELAPPGTPIFAEAVVRPAGELKSNTEAIAKKVAGVKDLGKLIVEELEASGRADGEGVDFDSEIEPWLGEHVGFFWTSGDTDEVNAIVESVDPAATQQFLERQVGKSEEPYRERSYEGVEYFFGGGDESAVGVVGDSLVQTQGERRFKQVVDASQGDSLASEDTFTEAIAAASDASLIDVYVDVGRLLEQSGDQVDPTARELLRNAGIDPSEASVVASAVPGSEQVAVELSSDLGGEEAPTGDASELLGSMPASAFAAIGISGFGEQLDEAIDSLDEGGIPDTVPPGQLKKGLKELGIDLEAVAGSLQDAAAFAQGSNEGNLGGALVLSTKGPQVTKTIANIGLLLRSVKVGGVTALKGKYSGFSIRSDDLGDKPLVIAARPERLAIGYGLAPTLSGLASGTGKGKTLSDLPAYSDAVAALGEAPISGFADGPAALRLADALIPNSDEDFEQAKKYLKSISFLALGTASQDDLATAKLIVGVK